MSGPPPGAAWHRQDVAGGFLEHRRRVLPLLEVQENLLLRALRGHNPQPRRLLDLGGGDGALTELLLSEWPDATAVLVDNSPTMLERAEARLARFGERWRAVRADLAGSSWQAALPPDAFDAIFSGFAIHHLDAPAKRTLFAAVFALLAPGGLFMNMDIVTVAGPLRGSFEQEMANNLVRSERERGSRRSEQEIARELSLSFDADEEDRPDSAEQQVAWLAQGGFEQAEIYFKWGEAAVYGGMRPAHVI